MVETPRIRPLAVIVCDDIRREDTGKFIAVGIYTDSINVSNLPAQLNFGLMLLFQTIGAGHVSFQLELRSPDNAKVGVNVEMDIHAEPKPYRTTAASFPRLPIVIAREGELTVRFRHKDEEWQTLNALSVSIDPTLQQDMVTLVPSETGQPA